MTKKSTEKDVKKDDPEQSRRFVEAAEALGADKSGRKFKKAIESLSGQSSKKSN